MNYLMPHRCIDCSEITASYLSICNDCWKKYCFIEEPFCKTCGLPFEIEIETESKCLGCEKNPPSFNKSRSLIKFDENSRPLIHKFKYQDKTILGLFFAKLIYARYKEIIMEADFIVCVPMHRLKRIIRMYNHSHIIATELSKISNITYFPDILHKKKLTKSQTFLSRSARKENLKDSLSVKNQDKIIGKKILLIDDVITTGETVNLCSKLLKKSGASAVNVLSIAKNYR